ncbi:hypothetical protein EJ06DRAFT_272423 [Trichodelitschia bisporula]|uniref:Uncharacterized protein n=1 Tax=Trichodelitschia bisporula TaxID=703511 RepID=A0A6G1I4W2_9PEZI|nr:hypothetical protein EJ06DRAFT_272423 [Trichodelitschia bisporula]
MWTSCRRLSTVGLHSHAPHSRILFFWTSRRASPCCNIYHFPSTWVARVELLPPPVSLPALYLALPRAIPFRSQSQIQPSEIPRGCIPHLRTHAVRRRSVQYPPSFRGARSRNPRCSRYAPGQAGQARNARPGTHVTVRPLVRVIPAVICAPLGSDHAACSVRGARSTPRCHL